MKPRTASSAEISRSDAGRPSATPAIDGPERPAQGSTPHEICGLVDAIPLADLNPTLSLAGILIEERRRTPYIRVGCSLLPIIGDWLPDLSRHA